jgi:hypothetical protein
MPEHVLDVAQRTTGERRLAGSLGRERAAPGMRGISRPAQPAGVQVLEPGGDGVGRQRLPGTTMTRQEDVCVVASPPALGAILSERLPQILVHRDGTRLAALRAHELDRSVVLADRSPGEAGDLDGSQSGFEREQDVEIKGNRSAKA